MRTSHLSTSAERLVDIESGGAKQTDSTVSAGRRQSIISGTYNSFFKERS